MNGKLMDMACCHSGHFLKLSILVVFYFQFLSASAQTGVDPRFLSSNTNSDGSVSLVTDLSSAYQATAETIITYQDIGRPDELVATRGRVYLASILADSTENLSLRLLGLPINSPDFSATLATITERQNQDGGVGAFVDFDSDLLSTSYFLRILSRAGIANQSSSNAVNYLLSKQNEEGSWSLQNNSNRIEITAKVINALWLYRQHYQLDTALSDGVDYLLTQRQNDLWHNTEASALALSALLNVATDRSPYQASFTRFAALQNSNGSFGGDVYLTALGLRVLNAMQQPAADAITLGGRIIDGDTNSPLADVQIELVGGQTVLGATNSDGTFNLQNIQANNYQLLFSLNGYSTLTTTMRLQPGDQRDFADLTLLRSTVSPATASVIGTITDSNGNSPLPGVTVIATGASQIAMTNEQGRFQINGVSPGTVTIQASSSNYTTASAVINVEAGQTFVFSPRLTSSSETQVVVEGVIVDRNTNQALSNVVVSTVNNGNEITATTDQSGRYNLSGLQAGSVNLNASLAGYHVVSVVTDALQGSHINFSPALTPEGQTPQPVANGNLIGQVLDRSSGLPLSGVDVELSYGSDTRAVVSAANGEFVFSDLVSGNAELSFSIASHQSLTLPVMRVSEHVLLNIGDISLLPEGVQETAVVRGVVVDSRSNLPLAGVTVAGEFASGNQTFTTLQDGSFEFIGLTDNTGELSFSLPNYNSVSFGLQLDLNEILDLGQIRLRPVEVDSLLPDLEVQSVDNRTVTTDLQRLTISGSVVATIRNSGNATVLTAVSASAFYDVNQNNRFDTGVDRELGRVALPETIAVDTDTTISIPVAGTLPFRDAPIHIFADSNQTLVELDEANNIASTADQCDESQCVGSGENNPINPIIKWTWQGPSVEPGANDVYGPVTVGQLTDDNGDGVIDINDDPDLIFSSFNRSSNIGILNAVSGIDGTEIWSTQDYDITQLGSNALADIDGDSIIEIVVVNDDRSELFAFEHDGTLKWRVATGPLKTNSPRDGIAIADLDGDGSPEIIHGRRVHNADGLLLWEGEGHSGDNADYGYLPTVADINLDGSPEVIAGRTAYDANGNTVWAPNIIIPRDGYTAIGNFDEDDFAEIVLVSIGRVYLLEHTGEIKWGPVFMPGSGFGGPPTISDLDGDGEPEIGIAGLRRYVALDTDGSILWDSPTQDFSSNRTGSSVFDFTGDGRVEILYGDEQYFRIYDGLTGETLYELANTSGTTLEYPVIADIDGDNSAEIIVTSTDSGYGIRVLESGNTPWANTRRIWNQHTYHINNIDENGTVPLQEAPSWLSHNTYRLNTFPGRNVFALPDLTVSQLSVFESTEESITVSARIGNGGGIRSLSGADVHFYRGNPSAGGVLIAEQSLSIIEPGQFIDITLDNISDISANDEITVVVDPNNEMAESREYNNEMSIVAASLSADISLALDGSYFGPNVDVGLITQVSNNGLLEGNYTVALAIFDSARVLVDTVTDHNISGLQPTQSLSFNDLWNTGAISTGSYIAQATLVNANGELLDTAEVNFTLSELVNPDGTPGTTPAVTIRATTDRPVYHLNDTVQLNALVENSTRIHPITNPRLQLQVRDASGAVVFNETVNLPSLAPTQLAEALRLLNLVQAFEGVYQYRATLTGNGDITYATAMANFEVVSDPNAALIASVTVLSADISPGDAQSCTFTLQNTSMQDLSSLAVNYRLLNVDSQQTISNESDLLSLAAGDVSNQQQSYATGGLSAGNYACVLEAAINGESRALGYRPFAVTGAVTNDIDLGLQLSLEPRLLVLIDPIQNTACTANQSLTLEASFAQTISDDQGVYAKLYDESSIYDVERSSPVEALEVNAQNPVNNNQAESDVSITLLDNHRIQITIFNINGLASYQRIAAILDTSGPETTLANAEINFTCDSTLAVGQQVGDFIVVELENIDLDTVTHLPIETPLVSDQHLALSTVLSHRSHHIVSSVDAFTQALLSGQYQQYLILSDKEPFDAYTSQLLAEAVYRGEGLIVASGSARQIERLESVLGIIPQYEYIGEQAILLQSNGSGIQLLETPLANTAHNIQFGLERRYTKIELIQASPAANLLGGEHANQALASYYQYGSGRSVYFGYDVLAELTELNDNFLNNSHVQLLDNSLRYTTPADIAARPGQVLPLTLSMSQTGDIANVTAAILWPLTSTIIDNLPQATVNAEQVSWPVSLPANQTVQFSSWAIPAYTNGQANITAAVYWGDSVAPTPYRQRLLSVPFVASEDPQLVLQALNTLIANEVDSNRLDGFTEALYWLEEAIYASNQSDYQTAVNNLFYTSQLLRYVHSLDSGNSELIVLRERVSWLFWQWGKEINQGGQP